MKYLKHIGLTAVLFSLFVQISFSQKSNDAELQKKFEYYFYAALNEKAKNNYAESFDLLQHCLALDSTNANVLIELSAFYSSLGETEKGLDLVDKSLKYDPDNYYYNMISAGLNKQSGNNKQVIEIYKSLLEKYPAKIDLYLELADAYSSDDQIENAIQSLDSLQKYSGDNPAITINKFRLYNMMNKKDDAFAEILSIVDKYPDNIKYKLLVGDLYLQDKEFDKAKEYYDQAIALDADEPALVLSMINYYDKIGEKEKSSMEIEKAMANPKMDIDAKLQLLGRYAGILNQNEQDTEKTNPLFEQLFEQHPNNSEISLLYGEVLLIQDNVDEALKQFERYKNENPKDPTGYVSIIEILIKDSTLSKASLDKIYEITTDGMANIPEAAEFYYYNSMVSLQKDNLEDGMATLKKGLENANFASPLIESDFYGQIGDIYHMLNNTPSAFENYDKALEINPYNLHILNNYSYYLSLQNKDLDRAEKMSSLAVKAEPTNSTFLDTYAWVLFKQKAYVMAKIYIEKAIEYGEDKISAEVYEHYGDILAVLDIMDEAVVQWKKAVEVGGSSKVLKKKIKRKKYFIK